MYTGKLNLQITPIKIWKKLKQKKYGNHLKSSMGQLTTTVFIIHYKCHKDALWRCSIAD